MTGFIKLAMAAAVLAIGGPALAAPCKNAAGKVIKCGAKPMAKRMCKVKGKMAPCGKVRSHETDVTGRVAYKW